MWMVVAPYSRLSVFWTLPPRFGPSAGSRSRFQYRCALREDLNNCCEPGSDAAYLERIILAIISG
jgi:hypothetical protein